MDRSGESFTTGFQAHPRQSPPVFLRETSMRRRKDVWKRNKGQANQVKQATCAGDPVWDARREASEKVIG